MIQGREWRVRGIKGIKIIVAWHLTSKRANMMMMEEMKDRKYLSS